MLVDATVTVCLLSSFSDWTTYPLSNNYLVPLISDGVGISVVSISFY